MTSRPSVRWIGFDLDECIGNLMPVSNFAKFISPESMIEALYPYEMCGETWLLRPGFAAVVTAVAAAYKDRKIWGAFLYSNNKRETTVQFARALLNKIAAESCGGVEPFKGAFHCHDPSRSSHDKNFADICNMLHCADLMPPTSTDDIVFFDDQIHPLVTEITHYYRVPKYESWTPVDKIVAAIGHLKSINAAEFDAAMLSTLKNQKDAEVVYDCPAVDPAVISYFTGGIQAFLDAAYATPVLDD